jgi:hypothetical protein
MVVPSMNYYVTDVVIDVPFAMGHECVILDPIMGQENIKITNK